MPAKRALEPAQGHVPCVEALDLALPRPPSFDEADVSDKPERVREARRLTDEVIEYLEPKYRRRAGGIKAVYDLVARTVKALKEAGELEHTYVVYTSDNGYLLGEHKMEAKKLRVRLKELKGCSGQDCQAAEGGADLSPCPYSPECVEGAFPEPRPEGVLGSSERRLPHTGSLCLSRRL